MAGRIPKDFIDQLITRVDIVEMIHARVPLKKAGREYTACCPFHGEKTPSFTVSPSKQFYHCFGCGVHGSVITFLMEYENLDYVEAIESLARHLGLEVPREQTSGQAPRHKTSQDEALYNLLEKTSQFYQQQLPQAAEAQAYIEQRGLSPAIVEQFALGYAPDAWDTIGQQFKQHFGQEKLLATGLQIKNEAGRIYDRFRGRLMFPIRDRRGRTIGFGGRVLGEGTPKYLNSPETAIFHKGEGLYGLYEARQQTRQLERMLVVEGYMDVIALAQFGVTYSVATLGTATTAAHIKQLYRAVTEIVFCFDGDRAGEQAAWRALETTLPELHDNRSARFLFLPQGEDPDSWIRQVGQEAFEEAVASALPLSQFFITGLKQHLGLKSDSTLHISEQRSKYLGEAGLLLEKMPNTLLKRELVKELGRLGNLDAAEKTILTQRQGKQPQAQAAIPLPSQREISKTPVRYAIALLVHSPQLIDYVDNPDKISEWNVPGLELLLQLIEIIEESPHIHSAGLLERFRDTGYEKILLKLMQWQPQELEDSVLIREFQDCFRQIRRQAHQKAVDELLHKSNTQGLTSGEKYDLLSLLHDIHNVSE